MFLEARIKRAYYIFAGQVPLLVSIDGQVDDWCRGGELKDKDRLKVSLDFCLKTLLC